MKDTRKEILEFWFGEVKPVQWFQQNAAFDELIEARFGTDYELAAKGIFDGWLDSVEGCLALAILLDQFPRNMFRGQARAFALDEKARQVTAHALERRFDVLLPGVDQKAFLYLPLSHSENMADQDRAVALFETFKDKNPVYYVHAGRHRDVIARFGRFPERNAALRRENTPQEEAYLAEQKGRP